MTSSGFHRMKIPFSIPFVFADGVEGTSQSDDFSLPYLEMRAPNSSFAFSRGGQQNAVSRRRGEKGREERRDPFKARF